MKFQWLENLESKESISWVHDQNDRVSAEIRDTDLFAQINKEALEICSGDQRLPFLYIHEGQFYDHHISLTNPLGVWRRCQLEEFKKSSPNWEVLLDLDELSRTTGDEWNFSSASHCPNSQRVLLRLSHRGKDLGWGREFDLVAKKFVANGFEIPPSKFAMAWVDENTIVVGGEIPEMRNDLGYSKTLRLWKRGDNEKTFLLSGKDNEMGVWPQFQMDDEGTNIITKWTHWDDGEYYLLQKDYSLKRLFVPNRIRDLVCLDGHFYFMILQDNLGQKAGAVFRISISEALKENPPYQLVWHPAKGQVGRDILKIHSQIAVIYLENIVSMIQTIGSEAEVIPEKLQVTEFYTDHSGNQVYLKMESFSSSPALYAWQPGNFEKVRSIPSLFTGDYLTTQCWAKSKDGTLIPYFQIQSRDLKIDENTPTLLYGYGGFDHIMQPTYSGIFGKLWLEKGGIQIVANIRGGGEFGRDWHEAARLKNKQKSYDDFIAVAEDLILRKITNPKKLGIYGRSNGGLLVGAVGMQRPELFNAIACQVPLLDMIRYVELPPGASWVREYGDPKDSQMKDIILQYSPYHNIKEDRDYPKILFITSLTDDRVHPSHARKMAAKMQDLGKDCYFYEESSGGHKGGNANVQALNHALIFTYLWQKLSL